MTLAWPFIGRADQVREIVATLKRSASPGLIVAGTSGVGKTRLVDEAVCALPPHFVTVRMHPTRILHRMSFEVLDAIYPAGSSRRGPHNTPKWEAERIRRYAESLTGDGRLVLVVDDLQFLDPQSAAALHLVAGKPRIHILATVNVDEPADDEVKDLWRDRVLVRHDLAPLGDPNVRDLLQRVLGGPVHARTVSELRSITGGNLVLLEALITAGKVAGTLGQHDGVWVWSGQPLLGNSAIDTLSGRFERAGAEAEAVTVLEYLALSEPIGVTVLVALTSAAAVEEAEAARLIRVERNDHRLEARLQHPLYATFLRKAMPVTRMGRMSRELADAVQTLGARRRGDLLRVALWQMDSDLPGHAATLAGAARQAFALYDFQAANRLARAALAAGADASTAVDMSLILASSGQWHSAIEVARSAFRQARSPLERAAAVYAEAFELGVGLGKLAAAEARLDEEEAALSAEPVPRGADGEEVQAALDEMVCGRTALWGFAGRVHDARDLALRHLEQRDRQLLPGPRAHLQTVAAWMLVHAGSLTQGVQLAQQTLSEWQGWRDARPSLAPFLVMTIAVAGVVAGRPADADSELAAWSALAPSGDWPVAEGVLGLVECWSLRLQGRYADALVVARDMVARSQDVRGSALGELAHCHSQLGNHAAAAAALDESEGLAEQSWGIHDYAHRFAAIRLVIQGGRTDDAAQAAEAFARSVAERGAYVVAAHAWHELTRLNVVLPPDAIEVIGRVEGPFAQIALEHAAALAAADADSLRAVSDRWAAANLWPFAADATGQAAAILEATGRPQDAAVAHARASLLAEHIDGSPSPAVLRARTLNLTPRERHVATLAAGGLSNLQIAGQLELSKRTVESHMGRIFTKIGINDRHRLREILGPAPNRPLPE
ncbi:LuxR family transcriptional regulator [Frankia sp. CiP3]|uniref:helix-turn-helix transcriptional regulator n=1 Tax=Frankia sp. CiP3 TaxID=2880971 RepID=UPI001EF59D3A|nr:LuxR family transcriptional regulator [Frankia sp. CiP3]